INLSKCLKPHPLTVRIVFKHVKLSQTSANEIERRKNKALRPHEPNDQFSQVRRKLERFMPEMVWGNTAEIAYRQFIFLRVDRKRFHCSAEHNYSNVECFGNIFL